MRSRRVLRQLVDQRLPIVGLLIVLAVVTMAVFAPYIAPHDPRNQHWGFEYLAPGQEFWLGTDGLGRDILSQLIWGSRTSIIVAAAGFFVAGSIGTILGLVAGYYGGRLDRVFSVLTDTVMTLPTFFLLLVVSSVLSVRSLPIMAVIIGLVDWPLLARVVRSQVLSIRELSFVEAARAHGNRSVRIIARHVLPNVLSTVLVIATLGMARYILYEASLAFLGLSDPKAVSWGLLLAQGRSVMYDAFWLTLFPGLAIVITVLGFNLAGDGLRDALDVQA